jgi:hypothetical protein
MEAVLKTCGKVGGIGGIALGVMLLLFQDLLKTVKIPFLTSEQWSNIVIIFMVLVWSVAFIGIIMTLYIKIVGTKRGMAAAKSNLKEKNKIGGSIKNVKKVRIGDEKYDPEDERYLSKNVVEGDITEVDEFRLGDGK